MSTFVLDLGSNRARRARYNRFLGNKWLTRFMPWLSVVFIVSGLILIIGDQPLGWTMLSPGVLFFILTAWQRGSLANTAVTNKTQNDTVELHNMLEMSSLARFKTNSLSAYDIWKALEPSEERYFIGNRFLLDGTFFEQLLDRNPGSSQVVWQQAEQLRQIHQTSGFSNMLVLVALVRTVPNIEQILRAAQLELKDVDTAIQWMADVIEKRNLARSSHNFGGIGRDWAFGYAPILRNLGQNITESIEMYGFFSDTRMHEPIVRQMMQTLGGGSTATLVGDSGVGKTTCVHAFAEQLLSNKSAPERIRYNQIIQLDAPSLIANAKNHGQLEELVLRLLHEAHKAKNIILFFDDAEAFFGTGSGTVDLTNVLLPVLESGGVPLILAMTPTSWQRLGDRGVISKLKPINVPPADEENSLAVLRDAVGIHEYRHKVVFTYQALQESYKLGSRYVTHMAMPGAALNILEQTATTATQQLITREVVQASVEQAYGIKLQQAQSSYEETSKLLNLESQLHQYVISQDRAVQVVSDALRRARSGVGNPNRPVGTFLFLGPTGVGKTELSKALARVYFGNESAVIRVDMNQFVGQDDVARLIAPMHGNELGFLGQVRKQPFSVILLDEIEKAHSSVVNALLQMLDEGVMRDHEGKAVSFKDAIIIATSNAGADEIRRMIDSGENTDAAEAAFVETLINRGIFAPEFVNRFDEVVIFKPLAPQDLIQVIDLIIDGINMTLDAQKVHVALTDAAKQWLVEKGYDSKLGARPMRRMAQRYVENIVAKRLLEQSVVSGGVISLDVSDFEALER
jgi:ATP-dependent Clp protease ATP-binding subunit ClpC